MSDTNGYGQLVHHLGYRQPYALPMPQVATSALFGDNATNTKTGVAIALADVGNVLQVGRMSKGAANRIAPTEYTATSKRKGSQFLDSDLPINSHSGPIGVQFIQTGIVENAGNNEVRRVGLGINPNHRHVIDDGPRLNLQTQINGNSIRTGPLADPHTPIDPTTNGPGGY